MDTQEPQFLELGHGPKRRRIAYRFDEGSDEGGDEGAAGAGGAGAGGDGLDIAPVAVAGVSAPLGAGVGLHLDAHRRPRMRRRPPGAGGPDGPGDLVVLDPAARRRPLDFFSTSYEQLKVRLYQVQPADYDAYGSYLRSQWNRDRPLPVPGKLVFDQLVKTPLGKDFATAEEKMHELV